MKHTYCTHFNIKYLAQAKALLHSLSFHDATSHLFMFCMDDECFSVLSKEKTNRFTPIHYSKLFKSFPSLQKAKENRSEVEFFFTCSSALCNFVFKNYPTVPLVTYLDADLYFFSNPKPIFDELKEKSIGIIHHKFTKLTKNNSIYGNYNVGWITFRNDVNGLKCSYDWMNNCIEWCYQKFEDGKYADQKYLDYWEDNYQGVHSIEHKGANVAIWNIGNYRISKKNDIIFIDDSPLIFYHFANLSLLSKNVFKTNLSRVFVKTKGVIKYDIYISYIKCLFSTKHTLYESKKDIYSSFFQKIIKTFSRNLRTLLFNDIIKL